MIDVTEKLKNLGYRPLKNDDIGATATFVDLLERDVGRLPEDYKEFLKARPWTGIFDDQIGFEGSEKSPWASLGVEILECLYGRCPDKSNDITAIRERLLQKLPSNVLAIGEVTGANFVCIYLDEKMFGGVCLWDHEHEENVRQGIYKVAPSFSEFIDLLRKMEQPAATQAKIVKVEISDALKARVAELNRNKRK
ncbi:MULTISPECIES: SMI1/KNR4 family protein [unclassified Paraburkholderia]|uniref:SMI1/KNR4 family protein n=1 Tax=unclassified Paraburkholderia TaxID=2615204 RepID=UPI002AAFF0B9|nr:MULTISPECIES: SMI1/KNR4 family protein [unclassified Paraburkholderia]